MCVLDDMGRSDFELLHARAQRRRWRDGDVLVTFCVFDVLVMQGRDVMKLPLTERLALLPRILDPAPANVLIARHVDAAMISKPVSWLYDHAVTLELEGC